MSIVHHICWYNNLDVRRYVLCISLSDRFRTRFWMHIPLWDLVINFFTGPLSSADFAKVYSCSCLPYIIQYNNWQIKKSIMLGISLNRLFSDLHLRCTFLRGSTYKFLHYILFFSCLFKGQFMSIVYHISWSNNCKVGGYYFVYFFE